MKCGECSLSKRIGEWSIQCELNPRLYLFAFSDCAFSLQDLIDIRNRYRNLIPILGDLIARREREEARA